MRIGIIGIINHDTIETSDGREVRDLGGILYNATVLADLADEGTELYPVSRIGADCHDDMRRILASRPGVNTSGISIAPEGTSRNHIRYDAAMEKVERLTNHIDPIPLEQIEPYLDCDALLVNFIVGDDIGLETMREIRDGPPDCCTWTCTTSVSASKRTDAGDGALRRTGGCGWSCSTSCR